MAKYFPLSSPLSRCPYPFFSVRTKRISRFFPPFSVQTKRDFRKNDTLFSTKRHVVFSKTTRHFYKNNTSFSFYRIQPYSKKIFYSLPTATKSFFPLSQFCFLIVQTFLKTLLLTRAYAHASQEFLHFCCHKCHRKSINHYISTHCTKYIHFLTVKTYKGWKFGKKSHRQTQFLSEIGADILPSICSIFIARVTLVTAKNQHRCWKARAYTRVRKTPEFPPLYLLPFSRDYPK